MSQPFNGEWREPLGTSPAEASPFDNPALWGGNGGVDLPSIPDTSPFDPSDYGPLQIEVSPNGYSDEPVILDLDGNGVSLTQLSSSNQFFDMAGDGYQHRTAWAAAGDGVLVFDAQGDGVIDQHNEVVFTDWDPTAASDMQALKDVFDTNHNGKLDSGDAKFSSFKVWVTNADGTRTLKTFAQLGIASINLEEDKTRQALPDGSSIDGQATYTRTNGTTGTAATVTLAFEADGTALQTTTTHNADGSTTIDNKQLGQDGRIASETISKTSANGLTTTISFDRDGNGVVDQLQTDTTVVNADSSRTRTVSNTDKSGNLLDKTVTTTSADGKTVTILRDTNGGGPNEESETDVTNADGSKSVTIKALNPNGTANSNTVYTTSADGLTGTTKVDQDNNGVFDLTSTDVTVVNGDGSRTRTVSETNANGSLRDRVLTTSSNDGSSQTIKTDADGNASYEAIRTSTIVVDGSGNKTTTQSDTNGDGTLRAKTTTTISASGLSITTKDDFNGDGVIDLTTTDVTVVNGDGSRTQTVTRTNAAGGLVDKTINTKGSPYNVVRTTQVDSDGNGVIDQVDQVSVSGGVTTEVASSYAPNGTTLLGRVTTTTSADGLTQTVQVDRDGGGSADLTTVTSTVRNADGSATVTSTDKSANNVALRQTVRTTSADGLVETLKSDVDGNGTFEATTTSTTSVDGSGNILTAVTTVSANGTLASKVSTSLSADRKQTSVTSDANGDGKTDATETITTAADGSVTDLVQTYNPNGAVISRSTTVTNATGLSQTTTDDFDANGTIDRTTTDVTVLNTDGSRVETISVLGQDPTKPLRDKIIRTVSATGLSVTVQEDKDGNGTIDETSTDVTSLATNGTRTETITRKAGTTVTDKTVVTTNGTGISTKTQIDADGDGDFDLTRDDAITLGADGSRSESVTDTNINGSVRGRSLTTVSADRKTTTVNRDLDGSGNWDNIGTTAVQADGSVIDTVTATNAAGSSIYRKQKTTSANGLTWTVVLDDNGDGVTDELEAHSVTYNADGSTTVGYSEANYGFHIVYPNLHNNDFSVSTTTSANGLIKTIQVFNSHSAGLVIDHVINDVMTINADGSTTRSVGAAFTDTNDYYGESRTVTTSAHGDVIVDQLNIGNDSVIDVIDRTTLNADGSTTTSHSDNTPYGTLARKETTTTSANGRNISFEQDLNGDGTVDVSKSSVLDPSGSQTDVISSVFGTSKSKTTTTTSADGRTKTVNTDFDGDGTTDQSETSQSILNASGSVTDTRSDFNSNGSLKDKIVSTTSANGLTRTATIDLDGDGAVDENFSDTTVLNSDGSKTETIQTLYGDGTLKNKTTAVTSDDGLTVETSQDMDGDGRFEITTKSVTQNDGSVQTTTSYYDSAGTLISKNASMTTANGRINRTQYDFNGDGYYEFLGLSDVVPDSNGSYSATLRDAYMNYSVGANHVVDENGVDHIVVASNGRVVFLSQTLKDEKDTLDAASRIYDTVLDRDMTSAEREVYFTYGSLDILASTLAGSVQFGQKYGTLTNSEFVNRIYENAFGRRASLAEMDSWLTQLQSGALTKGGVVMKIAQSAEHLTVGNVHAVTNNTFNPRSTLQLDHTTDKLVAANIVDKLYRVGLGRLPDPGSSMYTQGILDGTWTEPRIADAIINSTEFRNKYGLQTNQSYINLLYQNAFGRAPTTQESNTWVSALGSYRISAADLMVVFAESPEELSAIGGQRSQSQSLQADAPVLSADQSAETDQTMFAESQEGQDEDVSPSFARALSPLSFLQPAEASTNSADDVIEPGRPMVDGHRQDESVTGPSIVDASSQRTTSPLDAPLEASAGSGQVVGSTPPDFLSWSVGQSAAVAVPSAETGSIGGPGWLDGLSTLKFAAAGIAAGGANSESAVPSTADADDGGVDLSLLKLVSAMASMMPQGAVDTTLPVGQVLPQEHQLAPPQH